MLLFFENPNFTAFDLHSTIIYIEANKDYLNKVTQDNLFCPEKSVFVAIQIQFYHNIYREQKNNGGLYARSSGTYKHIHNTHGI